MPTRSPIYVTSLVAAALFMENLDGTIIATALPQMARSFHVGAVALNIGMTAYMLTLAVFIPISGWVADRFGARSVFASAIAIFTFASLLCAASHNLTQFTLMRILQGIGGAMMVPVGRLIVLRNTPKEQLTQAVAYMSWPGLSALVIGPPLGGFITTYFGWHWIFLLNLPLGAVAIVLTMFWIENVRAEEQLPFDWLTFLFAGFASSGTVFAMEKLGGGEHWRAATLILAASAVSGLLAIRAARRSPETSFIDLKSLRTKTYSVCVFGGSGFRIAAAVIPFLLPLMFQVSFGLNAFRSGLYLLALFGGDLSMKIFVFQALRRFGFRRILIVNGILTSLSIGVCAIFTPHTAPWLIALILCVHGAFRSTELTCLSTIAYTDIPPERMSRANGFLSAVMQMSIGMGVAIGALALRAIATVHGHSPATPSLSDFHIALLFVAILALAPVLDSLSLHPDAGARTSGRQRVEKTSELLMQPE